ncbi:MAG: hypothetical protein HZB55_14860 [Deltaproteobacteria bacterium]|nr:hypothetical protein [Deltaproteobacteria bacterium]
MDREATHPLTPEEAKARLLSAADDAGLVSWTRHHPVEGVSLAFLLGVLTGGSPDARHAIRDTLLLFARDT